MAAPIQPLVLDSIGIYGLNKQSSPSSLEPQWLTEADNVMLDDKGNVTTRKGIRQITDLIGASSSNSYIVKSLGEFRNSTGSSTIFAGSNDKIYKMNTSNTPYTLDAQTFTGTPQTLTDGNWEFCNFNDKFYGVQSSHTPIYYDGTNWMDLADASGFSAPSGVTTFDPTSCLGGFGRLWVGGVAEANDVVYYSDTLIGHKFQTGAAGYVDMKTVWAGDQVTALASFMGKLVIFGKRNIAVYNSPDDPSASTFELDEVIRGVGCVARDSVQALGDDIIFLSNSGVRSLQRTMVKDKMPLMDLSLNIKDEITTHIVSADMAQVKGQYCLCGGYYALSFPDRNITYVFDFKGGTGDAPRITTWNFSTSKAPRSLLSTTDGVMYIGGGYSDYKGRVSTYTDYYDVEKTDVTTTYTTSSACTTAGHVWESTNSKCWETTNSTYQADFKTVWLDFGDPSRAKLLKRFLAIISGGKNMDVTMNWYRDYKVTADSGSFTLSPTASGTSYLWGGSTSLYGAAKYAPAFQPAEYKLSLSKSAKVLRMEMKGTVNGFKASLQQMIIWAKQGKIR
jgi:hypothetical protein